VYWREYGIYTVVDRVLLRPLPYPPPERLALAVAAIAALVPALRIVGLDPIRALR
jgi:hypothetical protein